MRLCCTLIRELRVVTELDSEPNSIPYRPATNSWRKCLADMTYQLNVTSLIHCKDSSSGSARVKFDG